jgi:hypothetical protein
MGEIRGHDDIVARAACLPAVIDVHLVLVGDVMNVQRLSADAAGRAEASSGFYSARPSPQLAPARAGEGAFNRGVARAFPSFPSKRLRKRFDRDILPSASAE